MPIQKTDISTIIVTWNVKEYVIACLESLLNRGKCKCEIIVIDNASKDGTAHHIKDKFPDVEVIENKENVGFGRGNNQGIRIAKGRYVLLLNPDTVIFGNAVDEIVRLMDSHEEISIAGGKILNSDGSIQPSVGLYPTLARDFLYASGLTTLLRHLERKLGFRRDYENSNDVIELRRRYCSGAFLIIRKELFGEIGLLEECYPLYFEETDFCYRALMRGYRIGYFPNVKVRHYGGQSSSQLGKNALKMHFESLFIFYLKHFSDWRLFCSRVVVFCGSLVRFCLLLPFWMKNCGAISNHVNSCVAIAKTAYTSIKLDKASEE